MYRNTLPFANRKVIPKQLQCNSLTKCQTSSQFLISSMEICNGQKKKKKKEIPRKFCLTLFSDFFKNFSLTIRVKQIPSFRYICIIIFTPSFFFYECRFSHTKWRVVSFALIQIIKDPFWLGDFTHLYYKTVKAASHRASLMRQSNKRATPLWYSHFSVLGPQGPGGNLTIQAYSSSGRKGPRSLRGACLFTVMQVSNKWRQGLGKFDFSSHFCHRP